MKKTLTLALAFVLVAALAIGGTVAYLTATTGNVKNTFTIGKVQIDLDETDMTNITGPRVKENSYKLIPGKVQAKDPIVHVKATSEACYVFIHVENGIVSAEQEAGADYKTIAAQIAENGWTAVENKEGYYYKTVSAEQAAAGIDLPVFAQFGIKGDLTDAEYTALDGKTIVVKAFAVQSEGVDLNTAVAQFPGEF